MRYFLVSFLPSLVLALTITSPQPNTNIDPTLPLTITWTSLSTDPSTISLKIDNADPNALSTSQILASGISTSLGKWVVEGNTVQNWGTGYQILALSGNGGDGDQGALGKVEGLTLGQGGGSGGSVVTAGNGQVSYVSAPATATGGQGAGQGQGETTVTQTQQATTVLSGTVTATVSTTGAATGTGVVETGSVSGSGTESTSRGSASASGFVTSSTTRSGSGTGTAAATSAAETNTANRLNGVRLGVGFEGVVMGAAGVVAGLVAMIV
jgi:hypothetical protein